MTQEQKDLLKNWQNLFDDYYTADDDGFEWATGYRPKDVKALMERLFVAIREDQKEKDIRIVADHFSICKERGNCVLHPCKEHETALMNLIQNQ